MKKIYILALLISFTAFSFAQKASNGSIKVSNPFSLGSVETPTDTLMPYGIANATTFTVYTAASGGYVMGTNGYGDKAKAQTFDVTTSYKVEGVLIWAGAKEVVGTAGTLTVALTNCTGAGTASTGAVNTAPSSVISSVTVPMSAIDTAGDLTIATFASPVIVSARYAVVTDFATLGDDQFGMVSCGDGDPGTTETSWEKWSDNAWHTILAEWGGLTIDAAIFVVVDQSTAGIESHNFFDGIKFSAYPNPAINSTKIHYEIASSAKVQIDVIDMTGRIVTTLNEGFKTVGQHAVTLNTEELKSGVYFVSVNANGNRLTKRLTINK